MGNNVEKLKLNSPFVLRVLTHALCRLNVFTLSSNRFMNL